MLILIRSKNSLNIHISPLELNVFTVNIINYKFLIINKPKSASSIPRGEFQYLFIFVFYNFETQTNSVLS